MLNAAMGLLWSDDGKRTMKLLVVIVSYRVTNLTIDCLRSLSGEIARVPDIRVAVCENGTGGDAEEQLRRAIVENGWRSWVDLTAIYPNRGFTGGNNAVIRPALESDDPPEYILLLNADTLVQEHALDALISFMDAHPGAGIAGSQLLSRLMDRSNLRHSAFPESRPNLTGACGLGLSRNCCHAGVSCFPSREVPSGHGWVSGASMIAPADHARASRAPGRWPVYILRRPRPLPTSVPGRLGDMVCAGEPSRAPGGRHDRGYGQPNPITVSGLLAPGTTKVLPEELRAAAHGIRRRSIHPRLR